ncbi:MAG TPA: hypothetical protein VFS14_03400 [Candidatus Saccharimonadales bacterium]|nr:hypothetical protein [Candidatus Saccharimonadales bacterium]
MSIEAYEVSYKGEANERFKNALLDHVMRPAYEQAQNYEVLSSDPNVLELSFSEQYAEDGPMHVYTVYVAKGEPRLDIVAEAYFHPDDMTWQEAESLRLHALARHNLDEKFRDGLRNLKSAELLKLSGLMYIQEARYEIDLIDRTLCTTTELAFRLNGERFPLLGSNTELDEDRQMVFDADEVVDIIRALYGSTLVTEEQVKHFLNQDF